MIKKEHKSLIFAFPLKKEAFLLFCLLNLSVETALSHKNSLAIFLIVNCLLSTLILWYIKTYVFLDSF